jgi:hypothetical protein
MKIEEGVMHGRIGPVKTEYSKDELSLDPSAATSLFDWRQKSKGEVLLFPSPFADIAMMPLLYNRIRSVAPSGVLSHARNAEQFQTSPAQSM